MWPVLMSSNCGLVGLEEKQKLINLSGFMWRPFYIDHMTTLERPNSMFMQFWPAVNELSYNHFVDVFKEGTAWFGRWWVSLESKEKGRLRTPQVFVKFGDPWTSHLLPQETANHPPYRRFQSYLFNYGLRKYSNPRCCVEYVTKNREKDI